MLRTSRYANNNADDDDDEIDSRNTRVNRLSVKPSDLNKVYKSIKGYFQYTSYLEMCDALIGNKTPP